MMKKAAGKSIRGTRKDKKQDPSYQLERLSKRLAAEKLHVESPEASRGAAPEPLYRRIIE
jgi:hypothetical protein